jgi:hypothetical protein
LTWRSNQKDKPNSHSPPSTSTSSSPLTHSRQSQLGFERAKTEGFVDPTMFSSFSKFLPTNVNITTPDFLKSVTNNVNHSPEPTTSSPVDTKQRNVLTKQHKPPLEGDSELLHITTTTSVTESENAHNVDSTGPKGKNESRSKRRRDATATEVSQSHIPLTFSCVDHYGAILISFEFCMDPCPQGTIPANIVSYFDEILHDISSFHHTCSGLPSELW